MPAQKTLLILGGTSDIARATAIHYAQAGWRIILAARNTEATSRNANDISTRTGNNVEVIRLDILQTGEFHKIVEGLASLPDTVVCLVGELGDQLRAQTDSNYASIVMRTNFEGPALILGILAEKFLLRGSGTIVGVSSVAGDRGRGSNYIYGSAKAGFTAFLSGLRNRLASHGLRVVTVKPGFVRTRMTSHLQLPARLTAEPDEVGRAIYSAGEVTHRDVVYVRPIWRMIMAAICAIPERFFKATKL